MPHHKSCKKRILIAKKSNISNRQTKSRINTITKKILNAKTKESADEALKIGYQIIDKAAAKHVIHKNKASNQKSRLATVVNKMAKA